MNKENLQRKAATKVLKVSNKIVSQHNRKNIGFDTQSTTSFMISVIIS